MIELYDSSVTVSSCAKINYLDKTKFRNLQQGSDSLMALEVNHLDAGRVLRESLERVSRTPQKTCAIAETVDITMAGKGCLTYQYVLLTALVAKLTNPDIDMLSLQVDDPCSGAYAPRSLCKDVIYPFQKQILFNALNGSNSDPLVNKPARFLRLTKSNPARGDGKTALNHLCDSLPALTTEASTRDTLDYMMSKLITIAQKNKVRKKVVSSAIEDTGIQELYAFLSDLLDQGFGGAALVLASYALFRIQFSETNGYKIIPHPVNQSGSSKKQRSDLDIELNGKPFLGVELKDKPFTSDDVARASETALAGGLRNLLFVSGRHAGIPSVATYFSGVRKEYAEKGFSVGIIDVDELLDFVLVSHPGGRNTAQILSSVYDCVSDIGGTVETQTWVYSKLKSFG